MRYLRSILAVLTGLAFLVLLLVLALYVYITPERFHQQFSQSISTRFGITLDPTALPKIQHLPKLVVTYPQTTFTSVNTELKGSTKKISISMSPFAVFALKPRIEQISLQGLDLIVQKNNLSPLIEQVQNSSISFPLQHLEFKDAQLAILDNETTLFAINNIDMSLNNFNDLTSSYATEFLVKHSNFTGQGKLQGVLDAGQGLNHPKWINTYGEFTGLHNGQTTKLTTTVKHIASEEEKLILSDLHLNIETPQKTKVAFYMPKLSWDGLTLTASDCQANYAYATHNGSQKFVASSPLNVTMNPLAIYAPSITVTATEMRSTEDHALHNGNLEGSLFIDSPMNKGELKLTGQIFNAPTNIQLQLSNVSSFTILKNSSYDDSHNKPHVTGNLQLEHLDIGHLLPRWSNKILETVDAEVAFSLRTKNALKGIQYITGNLTIQKNQAQITHGHLVLPSGNAPYTASLIDDQWNITSEWKNIDLTDIAPTIMAGQCSGQLTATGNFNKPDLTRIQSTVQVGQGVLYGIDLPQIAEIMRTEQPTSAPLEALSRQSSCTFYNLEATLAGTRNQLNVTSGTFNGDNWQATLSGPTTHFSGQVNFLNSDQKVLFTLPLSVTPENAQWQLDWTTAVQSAIQSEGELPWSLQRLKNKVVRDLENWWANFDPMEMELPNIELPNIELPDIELPNLEIPDWLAPYWESESDNPTKPQPI